MLYPPEDARSTNRVLRALTSFMRRSPLTTTPRRHFIVHAAFVLIKLVIMMTVTQCLHFTAGYTTGWVDYANEPSQAALEPSSQDAYDVIDAQQGGCVDSRRCGAFDRNLKKTYYLLFIYFYPR